MIGETIAHYPPGAHQKKGGQADPPLEDKILATIPQCGKWSLSINLQRLNNRKIR